MGFLDKVKSAFSNVTEDIEDIEVIRSENKENIDDSRESPRTEEGYVTEEDSSYLDDNIVSLDNLPVDTYAVDETYEDGHSNVEVKRYQNEEDGDNGDGVDDISINLEENHGLKIANADYIEPGDVGDAIPPLTNEYQFDGISEYEEMGSDESLVSATIGGEDSVDLVEDFKLDSFTVNDSDTDEDDNEDLMVSLQPAPLRLEAHYLNNYRSESLRPLAVVDSKEDTVSPIVESDIFGVGLLDVSNLMHEKDRSADEGGEEGVYSGDRSEEGRVFDNESSEDETDIEKVSYTKWRPAGN